MDILVKSKQILERVYMQDGRKRTESGDAIWYWDVSEAYRMSSVQVNF